MGNCFAKNTVNDNVNNTVNDLAQYDKIRIMPEIKPEYKTNQDRLEYYKHVMQFLSEQIDFVRDKNGLVYETYLELMLSHYLLSYKSYSDSKDDFKVLKKEIHIARLKQYHEIVDSPDFNIFLKALEDKGHVYCHSQLVLASSNIYLQASKHKDDSIEDQKNILEPLLDRFFGIYDYCKYSKDLNTKQE